MIREKIAVVLFNLGGPDRPQAIRPFLFNLFADPAIIRLPFFLRYPLAALISTLRSKGAAARSYAQLGGRSPLLPNTEAQAEALCRVLQARLPDAEVRCFIAMRYWHPRADATAKKVFAWGAKRIILLPLYPQFSTTTTASSITDWQQAGHAAGLSDAAAICCYPWQDGFVRALVAAIRPAIHQAAAHGPVRLLLSAHGLPEKVIRAGDPYQWQCEQTAQKIVAALGMPELDWALCYQSRVGPLRWIGPATEAEIARAAADRRSVVMVPIAFVSDHVETLVELDIEYRHLAEAAGVGYYQTVRAVGVAPDFIGGLADLVIERLGQGGTQTLPAGGRRLCAASWRGCPCREAA